MKTEEAEPIGPSVALVAGFIGCLAVGLLLMRAGIGVVARAYTHGDDVPADCWSVSGPERTACFDAYGSDIWTPAVLWVGAAGAVFVLTALVVFAALLSSRRSMEMAGWQSVRQ